MGTDLSTWLIDSPRECVISTISEKSTMIQAQVSIQKLNREK